MIFIRNELFTYLDKVSTNADGVKVLDDNVDISHLSLTFLPFSGIYVTGSFNCSANKLNSLFGSPAYVGGDFICISNYSLKTLIGGPSAVDGVYDVSWVGLTSLEGAPNKITRSFLCQGNNLTSL